MGDKSEIEVKFGAKRHLFGELFSRNFICWKFMISRCCLPENPYLALWIINFVLKNFLSFYVNVQNVEIA